MLDDGQAQTRPPCLPGPALIHPVKPLENPLLALLGDANAGVRHLHGYRIFPPGRHLHPDLPAGMVILHCVITEVIDHLVGNLPCPGDHGHIRVSLQV